MRVAFFTAAVVASTQAISLEDDNLDFLTDGTKLDSLVSTLTGDNQDDEHGVMDLSQIAGLVKNMVNLADFDKDDYDEVMSNVGGLSNAELEDEDFPQYSDLEYDFPEYFEDEFDYPEFEDDLFY